MIIKKSNKSKNGYTIKMSKKDWLSIGKQAGWVKTSFFPEREPEDRYDNPPVQVEPGDQHEYSSNPLQYDQHEWINKPDTATCIRSGGRGNDESWSYTWVFKGRPTEQELMNWAADNNQDWSYYYGGPGRGFHEEINIYRSGDRTIVKQIGGLDI